MDRIEREIKTAEIMIRMFCRHHHGAGLCCESCKELYEYVRRRTLKCPFGAGKPVCAKCTIHCYKPEMKEKIREVMKFSGPRMIYSHPILAIRHMVDARKKTPVSPKKPEIG